LTAATQLSPIDVVQAQLDAYNDQDLDAYCAAFAEGVIVADLNGGMTVQGIEAYRAKYVQVFKDFPQNKAELVNRIAVGATVVDHERVIRRPGGETFEVIAIYTLADGKIVRVDFAK
jgi:hypothetical protein